MATFITLTDLSCSLDDATDKSHVVTALTNPTFTRVAWDGRRQIDQICASYHLEISVDYRRRCDKELAFSKQSHL